MITYQRSAVLVTACVSITMCRRSATTAGSANTITILTLALNIPAAVCASMATTKGATTAGSANTITILTLVQSIPVAVYVSTEILQPGVASAWIGVNMRMWPVSAPSVGVSTRTHQARVPFAICRGASTALWFLLVRDGTNATARHTHTAVSEGLHTVIKTSAGTIRPLDPSGEDEVGLNISRFYRAILLPSDYVGYQCIIALSSGFQRDSTLGF